MNISDTAVETATDLYHEAYLKAFPQGGDAADHDEAVREGVTAVLASSQAVSERQWRFFWPSADPEMGGAQWRNQPPSSEEVAEWREDLLNVWVETRTVVYGQPSRANEFDVVN